MSDLWSTWHEETLNRTREGRGNQWVKSQGKRTEGQGRGKQLGGGEARLHNTIHSLKTRISKTVLGLKMERSLTSAQSKKNVGEDEEGGLTWVWLPLQKSFSQNHTHMTNGYEKIVMLSSA